MTPAELSAAELSAACKGASEPLWDAVVQGETEQQREARHTRAKAICATCPIRDECLANGLIGREEGVWGGRLMSTGRHGPPSLRVKQTNDERRARRALAKELLDQCRECGEVMRRGSLARHRQRWHDEAEAS